MTNGAGALQPSQTPCVRSRKYSRIAALRFLEAECLSIGLLDSAEFATASARNRRNLSS